jgi:hypothetical protein
MANTKFKPGKSGNPGGRPRGSRNLATLFRAEMSEIVDGDPRKISRLEAIIKAQADLAVKGDPRAAQAIINRFEKFEMALADRQAPAFTSADREAIAEIHRRLGLMEKSGAGNPPVKPGEGDAEGAA